MFGRVDTKNVKSTRIGHASSVLAPAGGLENGMIVKVGDLAVGETDIRDVADVTAATDRIAVIATPEIIPGEDNMKARMLRNFCIAEGKIGDAYDLERGDTFSVSDNLVALGTGVTDLAQAKYLVVEGKKYKAEKTLAEGKVGFKIERITDATAPNMFNPGLAYKMVHVVVA